MTLCFRIIISYWKFDKIRSMFQKFEEVGKSKDHLQKIELPSDTDIAKAERLSINQKSGWSGGKRPLQKKKMKVAAVLREKAYYEKIVCSTEDWILKASKQKAMIEKLKVKIRLIKRIMCTLHHKNGVRFDEEPLKGVFPDGIPEESNAEASDVTSSKDDDTEYDGSSSSEDFEDESEFDSSTDHESEPGKNGSSSVDQSIVPPKALVSSKTSQQQGSGSNAKMTPHHQNVPHEIHTISVANKDRSPGESLDSGYNIASTVAEFVKDRACQTEFVDVDNDLEFYDGKLTLFSGKL
ncbi:uncharacterized protein LOC118434511 isoform X2 [Folsomia candida]|uniref:Uncharacterized protein n=1 Tax=Folsomia candida TaxID=158441 RepID=A0A226ERX7_FOLCA|nr:uncharacterized protein LOC118434511 isoform X2 [Folsomia candida]OXA59541.1 hypothetical protein Fcan01_05219 [Folsomia candida]